MIRVQVGQQQKIDLFPAAGEKIVPGSIPRVIRAVNGAAVDHHRSIAGKDRYGLPLAHIQHGDKALSGSVIGPRHTQREEQRQHRQGSGQPKAQQLCGLCPYPQEKQQIHQNQPPDHQLVLQTKGGQAQRIHQSCAGENIPRKPGDC